MPSQTTQGLWIHPQASKHLLISPSPIPPCLRQQAQAQSQAILKFLPFMVGYFSLNVPSGLGVYWIANNLITTLTTYVQPATAYSIRRVCSCMYVM